MDQKEYKRLLLAACQMEIKAIALYASIAEKIKNEFAKRVFLDIAQLESKHLSQLKNLMKGDLSHLNLPKIEDLKLSENFEKPKLKANLSTEEAIKYAIKLEEEAMNYYIDLANLSDNPIHEEIYLKLSEMEKTHKYHFERLLLDIDSWQK